MRLILVLMVLCRVASPLLAGDEAATARVPTADAALLAEQGIEPTREGVTAFLRRLRPDQSSAKKVAKLIEQLGDSKFGVRESATRGLLELPMIPLAALRKAAASSDPELASRAKRILDHARVKTQVGSEQRRSRVVAAVCRTIRDKPIRGTTSLVLETIPLLKRADPLQAACDAVAAVAGPDDVPLLQRGIADGNVHVRIAAIRGLGKAAGKNARQKLRSLTGEAEPRVALAAAHALAEQGDRGVLAVLVKLAGGEDQTVRVRSVQILRALTVQNFALNAFSDPKSQQDRLAGWRQWMTTQGRTAKLHLPLKLRPLDEDLRRGLILHYSFDRDTGNRLRDTSGHGRDATLHHGYRFVAGVSGKALKLTGGGVTGEFGGHARLPFIDFSALKQFTIAVWVNEQNLSYDHGEAYVVFGSDRGTTENGSVCIGQFHGNIHFRVGEGWISTPFAKTDRDRWVHYAMTAGDGRIRAYKDGRLVADGAGRVSVFGKQAALGRHWWNDGHSTSTRFTGSLDDLRVYDRALSETEVRMLKRSADPAGTK